MRNWMLAVLVLAGLAIAGAAQATVARMTYLDQNTMLVPDDYDIYTFPHLVPGYSNSFFVNVSPTVWASTTIDIGSFGSIGLATNKPYSQKDLYKGLTTDPNLPNFKIQDIAGLPADGTPVAAGDVVNTSNLLVIPDDKLVLIWGKEFESFKLGGLLEWAQQDRESKWTPTDKNGAPAYDPAPVFGTGIVSTYFAGIFAVDPTIDALDNKQDSSALRLSPSIGFDLGSLAIDASVFLEFNGLSSSHKVQSINGVAGTTPAPDQCTITQTWKDKGNMSYGVNLRGTKEMSEKSRFVGVASYSGLDLSMKHQIDTSATGNLVTGALSTALNDSWVDTDQNYSVGDWDLTGGWVSNLNPRTLFVFGLSLKGSGTKYEKNDYSEKAAGTHPSENYLSGKSTTTINDFGLPFVAGVEYEAAPWAKIRATMGRYLIGSTDSTTTINGYLENGTSTGQTVEETSNNANINWKAGLGATLAWGQFGLDAGFSMDTDKLADSEPSYDGTANADLTFKF